MSAASAAPPLPPPRPARAAGALQHRRSPRTGPAAAASALCKTRGGPASGAARDGSSGWGGAGRLVGLERGGAGRLVGLERGGRSAAPPPRPAPAALNGSGAGSRRVPAVRPLLCSRRRRLGPAPAVPPGRSRDRFGSQADGPLLFSRGFSKPSEESGIFRSFLYIRPLQDLEMSTTLLSAFYDIDFLCKVRKSAFGWPGRGLPLPPCAERRSGLPGQRGGAGGPCRAGLCGRVTV